MKNVTLVGWCHSLTTHYFPRRPVFVFFQIPPPATCLSIGFALPPVVLGVWIVDPVHAATHLDIPALFLLLRVGTFDSHRSCAVTLTSPGLYRTPPFDIISEDFSGRLSCTLPPCSSSFSSLRCRCRNCSFFSSGKLSTFFT